MQQRATHVWTIFKPLCSLIFYTYLNGKHIIVVKTPQILKSAVCVPQVYLGHGPQQVLDVS